jgi:hypothetical protein
LFLYSGTVVGPLAFAALVSLAGGYAPGFFASAGVSLVAGLWMIRAAAAR